MVNRTIAIPIAEVIEGGSKAEFYAALRESLNLAMRIANLSMTECRRQDDWTQEKCGKLYTYPQVSASIPAGTSHATATICRNMESLYRQKRWRMIRGLESMRSQRSQPWPLLCNASTKTIKVVDAGEYLTAKIKLADKWWTVRLAGGSSHRDQIAGIRRAIAIGKIGDSKIWTDHKHKAIIGVSVQLPVAERKSLAGSMRVATCRDSLLAMTMPRSDVPFIINADQCKRWQAESDYRCQRLRQDRKSCANRRRIREEMNCIAHKNQCRMKTLCHEVSARVIEKAVRYKVATIELDMTVKSYVDHFPWFDLATKIKYKAEDMGINVIDATQAVVEPDAAKPHVYFKLSPSTGRIKIGRTSREDGGRHGSETDSPEELVILAVDNQPKTKLAAKEKHFHAMFQQHRVKGEWFHSEPILAWLRDAKWLGNAGNLSQIMQVLDAA